MPFGSHWLYLVILLVIALIIFGPGRLPEVGGGLGRAIKEFRKATTETTDSLKAAVHDPHAPVQPVVQQQQPIYAQPQIQQQQPIYAQPQIQQQPPVYAQPQIQQQQQPVYAQPPLPQQPVYAQPAVQPEYAAPPPQPVVQQPPAPLLEKAGHPGAESAPVQSPAARSDEPQA